MANLAQIERVLHLQAVQLFSYCSAAQVMRIAAIATERRFAAGERIYAVDDPADAIHCVVEGAVQLENPSTQTASVAPGEAFGVIDILSGRLRTSQATAGAETVTLAIDSEDFFDLLSNNIGIVRALVRVLSERVTTPLAW